MSDINRIKESWMELSQEEIDSLNNDAWRHYQLGGCLCYAHSSSECVCGSYDRKPVKRKPLADGTLELTESERIEFINLLVWHRFYDLESVKIVNDLLTIGRSNNGIHCDYIFLHSVKAIAYLLSKFELNILDK